MDDAKNERRLSLQPPAVFSNRFLIMASPNQVRIAFGEGGPEGTIYHLAAVVSRSNALELADLLNRLLKGAGDDSPSKAGVGGAGYH